MNKLKKERRVNLMKKTKLILFFMLLGIGICFFIPIKVFAQPIPDWYPEDWYNFITQYDYGFADGIFSQVEGWDENKFAIIIGESAGSVSEYEGYFIQYDIYEDLVYFEPVLQDAMTTWANIGFSYDLAYILEYDYQIEFTGLLYWNFQEKYWQIDYYNTYEQGLDYYRQRVQVLENLVSNLSNQLHLRNVEIQSLYGEINTLLNEIQYLENALELEFERGYNKGLLEGDYAEAYEEGFKAGQKSKLAENNEKFYNGIEKWLVPAIITVIALGGFVTIASIKRREV